MNGRLFPGDLVTILYRDREGALSTRTILVKDVFTSRTGAGYVKAYCFLRRDERVFRRDAILSVESTASPERMLDPPPASLTPSTRPVVSRDPPTGRERGLSGAPDQVTETPVEEKARTDAPSRKSGGGFLIVVAAAAVVFVLSRGQNLFPGAGAANIPQYSGTFLRLMEETTATPKQTPAVRRPSPPAPVYRNSLSSPETLLETLTYRGRRIEVFRTGSGLRYRLPPGSARLVSLREAHTRINNELFTADTGLADRKLLTLYAGADVNGDGSLDWTELSRFQSGLDAAYHYQSNSLALRPDEFLAAGGGDCEDWALVTCGLIRYWGGDAFVAIIAPESKESGHAVCLVYNAVKPDFCFAYSFEAGVYSGGARLSAGYYVPVDYGVVGGVTNAVKPDWSLTMVIVPESMYGKSY